MTDEHLIGKTVTLPRGVVVTCEAVDGLICTVVADDGTVDWIIRRVIEELPITHRRDEIGGELWRLVTPHG